MVSIYPSQTIFIKDPRANPGKNVLIIAGNTESLHRKKVNVLMIHTFVKKHFFIPRLLEKLY